MLSCNWSKCRHRIINLLQVPKECLWEYTLSYFSNARNLKSFLICIPLECNQMLGKFCKTLNCRLINVTNRNMPKRLTLKIFANIKFTNQIAYIVSWCFVFYLSNANFGIHCKNISGLLQTTDCFILNEFKLVKC